MDDLNTKLKEKLKMFDYIDSIVNNTNAQKNIVPDMIKKVSGPAISNDYSHPKPSFYLIQPKNKKGGNKSTNRHSSLENDNHFHNKHFNEASKYGNLYANFSNCFNDDISIEKSSSSLWGNTGDLITTRGYTEAPLTGKSRKTSKGVFTTNDRYGYDADHIVITHRRTCGHICKSASKMIAKNTKIDNSSDHIHIQSCDNALRNKRSSNITNVADRLNNYGRSIQNKREIKRKEEDETITRQMTPTILDRSRDLVRDPKLFPERLYPSHRIKVKFRDTNAWTEGNRKTEKIQSEITEQDTNNPNSYLCEPQMSNRCNSLGQIIEDPIYRKKKLSPDKIDNFEYKPALNQKSLKMAEKFGSPRERLRKKIRGKSKDHPNNILWRSPSFFDKMNVYPTEKKTRPKSLGRLNELYNLGVQNLKKREQMRRNKETQIEEEYKQYPFKPQNFTNFPLLYNIQITQPHNADETIDRKNTQLYDKQIQWRQKLNARRDKIREVDQKKIGQECTFNPQINKTVIDNDEKFILKNLDQMNNYVNQRRTALKKQKEYEEYKKAKLNQSNSSKYIRGKLLPREFRLQTEERSPRKSNSPDKDIIKQRQVNSVLHMRENLGTNDFFERKYDFSDPNEEKELNKNLKFNKNNKLQKPQEKKISLNSPCQPDYHNEADFLQAIKSIQSRITNLKL